MEKKINPLKQRKIDELIKKGSQISGFEEKVTKQYWEEIYGKVSQLMKGKSEDDILKRATRSFIAKVREKQISKLSSFTGVVIGIGKVNPMGQNLVKGSMNAYNRDKEKAIKDKKVQMVEGVPKALDRFGRIVDENQIERRIYGYVEDNGETKAFIAPLKGVVGGRNVLQEVPLNKEVVFEGKMGNENNGYLFINNAQNFKVNGDISQEEILSLMTGYFGEHKKIGELRDFLVENLQNKNPNPRVVLSGQVSNINDNSSRIRVIPDAISFEESIGEVVLVVPEEKRSQIDFSEQSLITVAGELWFSRVQQEGDEPEINLTPLNIVVTEKALEGLQTTPEEATKAIEDDEEQTEL